MTYSIDHGMWHTYQLGFIWNIIVLHFDWFKVSAVPCCVARAVWSHNLIRHVSCLMPCRGCVWSNRAGHAGAWSWNWTPIFMGKSRALAQGRSFCTCVVYTSVYSRWKAIFTSMYKILSIYNSRVHIKGLYSGIKGLYSGPGIGSKQKVRGNDTSVWVLCVSEAGEQRKGGLGILQKVVAGRWTGGMYSYRPTLSVLKYKMF
jgi:hypothetical protein